MKNITPDHNDPRAVNTQTIEELEQLANESEKQKLPEQQAVFKADSIKDRARKRGVSNLPDRLNPPMGFDSNKAFDNVYPFIKLPFLHPNTPEDNISFGFPEEEQNKIYFGDNLHVLRALKSNTIDLIYIDPPFFSGRNYNQIWGDDNEVRTFYDIWEDGLPSYLVWLNARLWEMKRVLKETGSIYVHCDWHASHYIKCEMDKLFGYENFRNEIVWGYTGPRKSPRAFSKKHDVILFFSKSDSYKFNEQRVPHKSGVHNTGQVFGSMDEGDEETKEMLERRGKLLEDWWVDIWSTDRYRKELIGYPTQKPEALLERIIKSSTDDGDIVADFFMGGGTTPAEAMKLGRKFIGCDISRVAASVTIDRVINVGEQISGNKANISKTENLQSLLLGQNTPDIKIFYLGVYPIEKFSSLSQEQFEEFILTCYGSRRFTGEGKITGVMNSQTNILVGSSNPAESVNETDLKQFVSDSLRLRYQENSRMKLKVLAWTFPPNLQKYAKTLESYFAKQNIVVDIELIPINSQLFRKRIIEHYQDTQDNEFLLLFVTSPSIPEIRYKKISELTYEFEAVSARSNNLNGYLINCQWDFDFKNGLFSEPEYSLMRETAKSGKYAGKYIALLKCQKKFEKPGKYLIACRVQDNMGSEASKILEIEVS
ncbi:MAG: site-specific DNA-methyltransferase [Actinomycetota bacterium]